MSERREAVLRAHHVSKTRRCELLQVPRSTAYYTPRQASTKDLELMRQLDEIHLLYPFYGSRRIVDELDTQGYPVNRKRVQLTFSPKR